MGPAGAGSMKRRQDDAAVSPPGYGWSTDIPLVLTAQETADLLRVDVKTVYDAISQGELAAARIGRKRVVRIAREAVLSLLQGRVLPEGK